MNVHSPSYNGRPRTATTMTTTSTSTTLASTDRSSRSKSSKSSKAKAKTSPSVESPSIWYTPLTYNIYARTFDPALFVVDTKYMPIRPNAGHSQHERRPEHHSKLEPLRPFHFYYKTDDPLPLIEPNVRSGRLPAQEIAALEALMHTDSLSRRRSLAPIRRGLNSARRPEDDFWIGPPNSQRVKH